MKTSHRPARRPRLTLHTLERRDNPAGSVTALYSNGVLTLTGDAEANVVQISATPSTTGSEAILTGLDNTRIVGDTTFEGVRAVRANLNGGGDAIAADPGLPFALSGGLSVDFGAGDSTLNLQPSGTLALGSLTVHSGRGTDAITLAGPDGGTNRISGPMSLKVGDGGSATTLSNLDVFGRMTLSAGDGDDTLSMDHVRVGQPSGPGGVQAGLAQVFAGKGALSVDLTSGTMPSMSLSAAGAVQLTATGSNFAALTATSGDSAQVSFADTIAFRGVTVTGGPKARAGFSMSGDHAAVGPVSVHGGDADVEVTDAPAGRIGTLDVLGSTSARFGTDGSVLQIDGPASVKATAGTAALSAAGTQVLWAKNLSVSGWDHSDVSFDTTGTGDSSSRIGGSLIVTGGQGDDSVLANENLHVAGDLRMALGDGTNTVILGGEVPGMAVDGQVSIKTGKDSDSILLQNFAVRGPMSISTGAGDDNLNIQGQSTFKSTVAIDQGAGTDTMAIGTAADGVLFAGVVNIQQGTGDDQMIVGVPNDQAAVTFAVPGSRIDGGAGTDALAQSVVWVGKKENVEFLHYETQD
jgi:hypothetical protein